MKGFCVSASSSPKLSWRTHTSTLREYLGDRNGVRSQRSDPAPPPFDRPRPVTNRSGSVPAAGPPTVRPDRSSGPAAGPARSRPPDGSGAGAIGASATAAGTEVVGNGAASREIPGGTGRSESAVAARDRFRGAPSGSNRLLLVRLPSAFQGPGCRCVPVPAQITADAL
jgi:hypothetical protein